MERDQCQSTVLTDSRTRIESIKTGGRRTKRLAPTSISIGATRRSTCATESLLRSQFRRSPSIVLAGHSVNRSKYSLPEDVLEPDCCDGNFRPEYVVLQILVSELPTEITASNGTSYRIRPVHRPKETCYSHSEIWCNEQGDIDQPYQRPPKDVRNLFYGELARAFARRRPLDFTAER